MNMLRPALLVLWLVVAVPVAALAKDRATGPLAPAEAAFLDYLDAVGAVGYLESGGTERYEGRDLAAWQGLRTTRRSALDAALVRIEPDRLDPADRAALASLRRTLAEQDAGSPSTARAARCAAAQDRGLGYEALKAALVACFVEHGNRMRYDGHVIDRGTALQTLHLEEDPTKRQALFAALGPLWAALNGRNEPDSPYRRLLALAAADARVHGSEIDVAARALGVDVGDVERWLVQLLEAWRDATPATPVEPWDFRYVHGLANRQLQARIPLAALRPVTERFYRDLGADLEALEVVQDLAPRPDKSPLAYSDFLRRGRETAQGWRRPRARVLGTYPDGGLFALNELVHENGHAVHVSAIATRPAYMDWPDTLLTEAFADVPAWSVHEPAWQRRYLGDAIDAAPSLRALFANVMLDVAWSLFELRLLRTPDADPNVVWSDITQHYLHVRPHPELPWWALRVQLVDSPGYMVNYGLGALLTAEIRARTAAAIGPFEAGNARWYPWLSDRLLQFGSERDSRTLLLQLLGRPVTPEALLVQLRRCGSTR